MIGDLAKSKAGHDKERVYVIINEDNEYVYLADGAIRTLDNPKRKKKKHIQIIHNKINKTQMTRNEEIKRTIRMYKEEDKNVESRCN